MNFLNDLTVIIVTYKTNREILENCINSIDPTVKILIVENSSDKDFEEWHSLGHLNILNWV